LILEENEVGSMGETLDPPPVANGHTEQADGRGWTGDDLNCISQKEGFSWLKIV